MAIVVRDGSQGAASDNPQAIVIAFAILTRTHGVGARLFLIVVALATQTGRSGWFSIDSATLAFEAPMRHVTGPVAC